MFKSSGSDGSHPAEEAVSFGSLMQQMSSSGCEQSSGVLGRADVVLHEASPVHEEAAQFSVGFIAGAGCVACLKRA